MTKQERKTISRVCKLLLRVCVCSRKLETFLRRMNERIEGK